MCKACSMSTKKIGKVKSKKFPVSLTDVGAMFGGLVANFAINGVVAKATENLDPQTGEMVNKYLPYGKAAVGLAPIVYPKAAKKLPRIVKAAGVGMAVGAGVEIVSDLAPDLIKMAGAGDFYDSLGNADTDMLIIEPSGSLSELSGAGDSYADFSEADALYGAEADALYGTGDLADMAM